MQVQLNLFSDPSFACLQCGEIITNRAELAKRCPKPAVAGGSHTIIYHQHALLYRQEFGFSEKA